MLPEPIVLMLHSAASTEHQKSDLAVAAAVICNVRQGPCGCVADKNEWK
jgi:hypothetical protein